MLYEITLLQILTTVALTLAGSRAPVGTWQLPSAATPAPPVRPPLSAMVSCAADRLLLSRVHTRYAATLAPPAGRRWMVRWPAQPVRPAWRAMECSADRAVSPPAMPTKSARSRSAQRKPRLLSRRANSRLLLLLLMVMMTWTRRWRRWLFTPSTCLIPPRCATNPAGG